MQVEMSECLHGVPLVNGIGCLICTPKPVVKKVKEKLAKVRQPTVKTQKLIDLDAVEEILADQFV